jgi:hypothetical protein
MTKPIRLAQPKVLIKGDEGDLYRLYKQVTPNGVYYIRKVGKDHKTEVYKLKRWDRPVGMQIGALPVSNVKYLGDSESVIR